MPRVFYLDTGPIGLACHTRPDEDRESGGCQFWMGTALTNRVKIIIPAIADYELRRELIRNGSLDSVANLDLIKSGRHPKFPEVQYLPLDDDAIQRAAELWAEARNRGYPTAAEQALDGDVLVSAQALANAGTATRFVIVTGNTKDLARYVGSRRARTWSDVSP